MITKLGQCRRQPSIKSRNQIVLYSKLKKHSYTSLLTFNIKTHNPIKNGLLEKTLNRIQKKLFPAAKLQFFVDSARVSLQQFFKPCSWINQRAHDLAFTPCNSCSFASKFGVFRASGKKLPKILFFLSLIPSLHMVIDMHTLWSSGLVVWRPEWNVDFAAFVCK